MSRPKVLRFSAAERDNIRKHVIGKPTGVLFSVAGVSIDLVPITVQEAKDIFRLVNSIQTALGAATPGEGGLTNFDASNIAATIANDGPRAANLFYSILWRSALATKLEDGESLIDEAHDGKDVFDEWFDNLPLKETLIAFFPKLLESQGLGTVLGNSSTPPQEPTTTAATGNSTP